MFKKFALAAMAVVSVSAFAADNTNWQDPSTMSYSDAKKAIMTRAWEAINPGDAYLLSNVIDRSPTTVANALAFALAHNHWQARIISEELAMSRFPVDRTSYTTTVTNPDGTVTTTTTTTSTAYTDTYAENMRPMRIVMEPNASSRDIEWGQALDILCSNITTAEATQLRDWWWNTASEREKDVMVRILEANAKLADTVTYSSIWRRQ
ncbi:MAG TPA: hypothetical protein VK934_01185 [Fimbriimonas sp.]|nr:hypothetical protein [Fimbriimonas sp.]